MKKLKSISLFVVFSVALLALVACNSKSSGSLTREPVSFITIGGVDSPVVVQIDESESINLTPREKNRSINLQLKPGKHQIRITRDGLTVVDRVVLLSDQQTMEINLP